MIAKRVNLFDDSFLKSFDELISHAWIPTTVTNIKNKSVPPTNVKKDDDGWNLELAVPGLMKENFDIKLEDDELIIGYNEKDFDEDEVNNYTKKEFAYSSFTKRFKIPDDIDKNKITSKYENGVLKLILPKDKKKMEERVKKIKIE